MSNQLTTKNQTHVAAFEQALVQGNLASLSPEQRVAYYNHTCESLGLNPLTKPFEYITLNSKLTLYAKRDCTDQLRSIKGVSVKVVSRERIDDLLVVTAQASLPNGRVDESVGAVTIAGLRGDALANAMMKAETKAKRRVTLSICGLGILDETEVASIPGLEAAIKLTEPEKKITPVVTAAVEFAKPNDPVLDADYSEKLPANDLMPWEKAPSSTQLTTQTNVPHELEEYEIQGGQLKGTKFKDRPDAFWMEYRQTLENKLGKPDFPEAFRKDAAEVLSRLHTYLADK